MFARVAMYHGATADGIDELIANINGQIEADTYSPPASLEGMQELMMFADRSSGRALNPDRATIVGLPPPAGIPRNG